MKKSEFDSGQKARKSFEEGMMKLFRVAKSAVTKMPEPKKTPAPKKGENEN